MRLVSVNSHWTDKVIGLQSEDRTTQLSEHTLRRIPDEQSGDAASRNCPHDQDIDAFGGNELEDDILGFPSALNQPVLVRIGA